MKSKAALHRLIFPILFPWLIHAAETPTEKPASVFEAHVKSNTDNLSLDETLQVDLTLVYPSNFNPNIKAIKEHLLYHSALDLPAFDLIKLEEEKERGDSNLIKHILKFTLDPQKSGKRALSFYEIPFHSIDNREEKLLFSEVFFVEVLPLIPPKQSFKWIAPILPFLPLWPLELNVHNRQELKDKIASSLQENSTKFKEQEIPWLFLGMALLTVFFIFIDLQYAPREWIPSPRQRLAQARYKANLELNKLKKKQFASPNLFYMNISHLLRCFVQDSLQVNALSSTTTELEQKISPIPLATETKAQLIQILKTNDQVQFAKLTVSQEECRKVEEFAHHFIADTDNA